VFKNNWTTQDLDVTELLKVFISYFAVPVKVIKADRGLLPVNIKTTLANIGQEAIINISKHAGSHARGRIELLVTEDSYCLIISDNGVGFEPNQILKRKDSYGLEAIQWYSEKIQARCTIHSAPEQGTRITISGSY
jgi:two-component system, NarL family, nitrate/nitrite sensor histidine kinase NarX